MAESPYPELKRRFPAWEPREYFRRARRIGEYWKWLGLAPFVVCLVWVAVEAGRGNWGLFQSGPVATANSRPGGDSHASFNNDCSRCHVEKWQTLRRFWDPHCRTVANSGCVGCHAPDQRDEEAESAFQGVTAPCHAEQQVPERVPACAACHREHRERETLRAVKDGYCTDCHADLQRKDEKRSSLGNVNSFTGDGHPAFRWPEDPGKLRFNHAAHLPEGGLPGRDGMKVQLGCRDCHDLQDAGREVERGRYMKPISYDRDCKKCHPLSLPLAEDWTEPELLAAAEALRKTPAPHGLAPAQVVEELQQRYTRLAREYPVVLSAPTVAEPARPIPGPHRPEPIPSTHDSWVAFQVETAKRVLFQAGGGCRFCHEGRGEVRPDELPSYAPTAIPGRWLERAFFSHTVHGRPKEDGKPIADCADCHCEACGSQRTSDVLMPTLQDCLKCHGVTAVAETRGKSDCVTCHRYHDRQKEHLSRSRGR
jgi:hypothetical protein